MSIVNKTEDRRMVRDVPDTEVTGSILPPMKSQIIIIGTLDTDR